MRRRIGAAALLALLLLPAAAHAQGGETDSEGSEYRIPMQTQTISAVVDLKPGDRALELYRSLIPRGYAMPQRPQVAMYLTEPNIPSKLPGQPYNEYTRWIEGPLAIKVSFGRGEGYFPIVMPVSSKFEYDLGRAAGLPKVLVEGALEPSEGGFTVRTTVRGKKAITLRWRAGSSEVGDEAQAWAHNAYPLYALLPALKGPDLFFTKFTPEPVTPAGGTAPVPPPNVQTEPEIGLVDYDIEPDLDALDDTLPDLFKARRASLADLIEPRATVPGLYWDLQQILRLRSGDIGDGGGYGDSPTARPSPGASPPARVARRCSSRRLVRITLRGRAGRRARTANVLLDGKRFRRSAVRRGRVVVDLTGLPEGRFRVTVRARSVSTTRTYRTCVRRGS